MKKNIMRKETQKIKLTVKMSWEEFLRYYETKEPLYIKGEPFVFNRNDFLTFKKWGFLDWKKVRLEVMFYIKNEE